MLGLLLLLLALLVTTDCSSLCVFENSGNGCIMKAPVSVLRVRPVSAIGYMQRQSECASRSNWRRVLVPVGQKDLLSTGNVN